MTEEEDRLFWEKGLVPTGTSEWMVRKSLGRLINGEGGGKKIRTQKEVLDLYEGLLRMKHPSYQAMIDEEFAKLAVGGDNRWLLCGLKIPLELENQMGCILRTLVDQGRGGEILQRALVEVNEWNVGMLAASERSPLAMKFIVNQVRGFIAGNPLAWGSELPHLVRYGRGDDLEDGLLAIEELERRGGMWRGSLAVVGRNLRFLGWDTERDGVLRSEMVWRLLSDEQVESLGRERFAHRLSVASGPVRAAMVSRVAVFRPQEKDETVAKLGGEV